MLQLVGSSKADFTWPSSYSSATVVRVKPITIIKGHLASSHKDYL